ncbi:hypothetical protein DXV75_05535 [Alteromonas aestuariivivens]|uniref:Uncharacterized protein n=1 Tax=Alteromonas aestuariivivens TaxID=1938339 RepID=A0A3D8MB19_9ALTE|nr:hypothetical protein [Alteromonas aestuariivivens]RDV27490.1 hypothetical protein DXV75_05535 [Alteromonas aestuariivivens]
MKKLIIALSLFGLALTGWFVYLSQQSAESVARVPVITVMDILHASDLQEGVKEAVKKQDDKAVKEWLDKALYVAEEAELARSDIEYLGSVQAEEYVIFNANRALFNEAFEQRYYRLEGMDDLKTQYPQAKDLFAKAEALLAKRDSIVENIATTLANGDAPGKAEIQQAKRMWQERYQHNLSSEGE